MNGIHLHDQQLLRDFTMLANANLLAFLGFVGGILYEVFNTMRLVE